MKLVVFTDAYPFDGSEPYLHNELPYLLESFEHISIVPLRQSPFKRELPPNVEVLDLHQEVDWSIFSKVKATFKALFLAKNANVYSTSKVNYFASVRSAVNAILYAQALERKLGDDISNTVFYSYWFYHWALIIAIIKNQNPALKCVARAHMADIYDEIRITPFKQFKLENLSEIYPISDHAINRFLSYDSKFESKLNKQFLGVTSKGRNPVNEDKDFYQIVSCSSVRTAKRVDFIARSIVLCKSKIRWTHFGDGNEMGVVKSLIQNLPSNIEVELQGYIPNEEVLSFYLNEPIDLFINISTQEGLPVSLMEAISYGIPVMGTNVYGTPEIVNEKTGILVQVDETEQDIAGKIDFFLENDSLSREEIVRFWEDNFCAETNYRAFSKRLLEH